MLCLRRAKWLMVSLRAETTACILSSLLQTGHVSLGLFLALVLDCSTLEASSPAGSNKPNLLPCWCVPPDCGGMPNMLVITTTMGMLYRVHGHTTHLHVKML